MTPVRTSRRPAASSFGRRLREFRDAARLSQLELGFRANVSARHISFLETGRARPSREMIANLARTLELPLRDHNLLMTAAGFSETYRQSDLSAPELAEVRRALDLLLEKHEPWPALVFNARWDLLSANGAAAHLMGWLLGSVPTAPGHGAANFFDLVFAPPFIDVTENWPELVAHATERVRREVEAGAGDTSLSERLEAALARPEVQAALRAHAGAIPTAPLLPAVFRKDGVRLAFYTTITTFGTPQDITLQEIRIECLFPADEATRTWLAAAAPPRSKGRAG